MLKKTLIIIFILYSLFFIFPKNKIDFRTSLDFYSNPFFYEHSNNMNCSSLNGSLMLGININKFSITGEIYDHYFTLTAQNDPDNFKGAWNIIRGTINGLYRPADWCEIKWGMGGAWYRSAFSNDNFDLIVKNEGGISFIFNAVFKPLYFIQPELINRLDLFFSNYSVTPYYYGGLKLTFHPYLEWINIYMETGAMTWFDNNDEYNIQTGMFVWTVGISFDLSITSSITKMKNKIQNKNNNIINDKKPDKKEKIIFNSKETKELELLKNANVGDIIALSSISFKKNKLNEKSYDFLNAAADILLTDNTLHIEIRCHSVMLNNINKELKLSLEKANEIKDVLIENGINENRIKTTGLGSLYIEELNIENPNQYVEIKILLKK